jgi:hypothetical protein
VGFFFDFYFIYFATTQRDPERETAGTILCCAICKYMATAVRLNEYLTPGYLIEYSTPSERQIGLVLEIHWIQRYGLSTIYVMSSESGCKMIYVKDVCVVY